MSKDLRGNGTVYRQKYATGQFGPIWWIAFRARGAKKDGSVGSILFRESSHSTERSEAVKLLKQRVSEVSGGKRVIGANAERLTLGAMMDALITRYQTDGKSSSLRMVQRARLHLVTYFGEHAKAIGITNERLDEYKVTRQQMLVTRLQDGADGRRIKIKVHPANGTINRELACLRIAFNQSLEANRLTRDHIPVIRLLSEKNAVRKGFVEPAAFEHLCAALPMSLRDAVRFLYLTSWRKGAMQSLEWRDLELEFDANRDIVGGQIHLRAENAKNGHAQTLPLGEKLLEIIKRAHAQRDPAVRYVFHRNGQQIESFRKAWSTACKAIGMPGLMVHDLRRSGVRNLLRAGVPERIAMGISGHRTRSIFDRYNIVSDADLSAAMTRVSAYNQARAAESPKVVPIRKMQL
jgi:integrase